MGRTRNPQGPSRKVCGGGGRKRTRLGVFYCGRAPGRQRLLATRRGRLGSLSCVRADLSVLGEKSRTAVLLRDRDPAAGLAGDLPLGRLHGPSGARCLARRAIVLLELANRPPQGGSLPTSTANTARRHAGIVECQLGLLPTFRATPTHPSTLPPAREVAVHGSAWLSCRRRWLVKYACGYAEHLNRHLSELSDRSRRACLGGAPKTGTVEAAV